MSTDQDIKQKIAIATRQSREDFNSILDFHNINCSQGTNEAEQLALIESRLEKHMVELVEMVQRSKGNKSN